MAGKKSFTGHLPVNQSQIPEPNGQQLDRLCNLCLKYVSKFGRVGFTRNSPKPIDIRYKGEKI